MLWTARTCRPALLGLVMTMLAVGLSACGSNDADLTVYSGRSSELVRPLLQQFADEHDIDIEVRYGQTSELAAQILEEGANSPADVFFAQDAGALGALADEARLATLPETVLDLVPPAFRSGDGLWVGTSGRARTLAYNPELVSEEELPDSVLDLVEPEWKGRIAWAPQNASFQAFVTGLRELRGDQAARRFLEGILANDPLEFPSNIPVVQAVGRGEVAVGLVNHYYVPRLTTEDPGLSARNHFFSGGDPGALVNVAGVGVVEGTDHRDRALELIRFLLSAEGQRYFAEETFEYPLIDGVDPDPSLPPLASLEPPAIDLSDLDDLRGTLDLLEETGAL